MSEQRGQYVTDHYVFHFALSSPAERDILAIAETQESCWREICRTLGVAPGFKIHYFLLGTPEEAGAAYGGDDPSPCNGFTRPPDKIYAVYNDDIHCIGAHEDAHIISYTINRPAQSFIREGLAMYFDKIWWGRPNEDWVREFLGNGQYIPVESLLDNDEFFRHSDAVTYPIAGAFTEFLLEKLGMEDYIALYREGSFDIGTLKEKLNCNGLDEAFQRWIKSSGRVPLETHDLLLRQGTPEDYEGLYRNLWSREEAFTYLFSRPSANTEAGRKKTAAYVQMHREVPTEFFVCEKSTGQVIGIAGIKELSPGHWTVTDVAIGPDFWGRGYGCQIVDALTELAFQKYGALDLSYSCFSENAASNRLALACGFSLTHSEAAELPKGKKTIVLNHYLKQKSNRP